MQVSGYLLWQTCGSRCGAVPRRSSMEPFYYTTVPPYPHPPAGRIAATVLLIQDAVMVLVLRRREHHRCLNLCHSCLATYTNKIPIRYPIAPLEKSYCPPSESQKRFHTAADSQLQHGTGLCVLPESTVPVR